MRKAEQNGNKRDLEVKANYFASKKIELGRALVLGNVLRIKLQKKRGNRKSLRKVYYKEKIPFKLEFK